MMMTPVNPNAGIKSAPRRLPMVRPVSAIFDCVYG
jgi:hypothetical protein